jgi:hypothetical protein
MIDFPAKLVSAIQVLKFNFTSLLGPTETISTQTVAASVYSGTDASPSSIISGSASASGAIVSQTITGGTSGVLYELKCTITTSLSQTLVLAGMLAVVPDL